MNAERLKTLQNRAEQATKIAEAIQQLTDAAASATGLALRPPHKGSQAAFSHELYRRVYEAGRLAVLEQLEQELEGWMGGDGGCTCVVSNANSPDGEMQHQPGCQSAGL